MKEVLIEDLKAKGYEQFLDVAVDVGGLGLFVIRKDSDMIKKHELLSEMSPFTIETQDVKKWPGTKLSEGEAKLFTFTLSKESVTILKKYSNSLGDWLNPELPEDLCFLREDKTAWFTSITHEDDFYLTVEESELKILMKELPDMFEGMLLVEKD